MPQLAAEDVRFIDRVFKVLDSNNSGIIEWPEFVYSIACLEKGSLAERADFLFRVSAPVVAIGCCCVISADMVRRLGV